MRKTENISLAPTGDIGKREPAFDRSGIQVGSRIHCRNGVVREIHDTSSFFVKVKKEKR